MNKRPTGIKLPTLWVDHLRFTWKFGIEIRRVFFCDHRSGWSGINLYLCFGPWSFDRCILCWFHAYKPEIPTLSLRDQIQAVHGPFVEDEETND